MKYFELYDHFKKNQSRLGDVAWLAAFLEPHCHFVFKGKPNSNLRLLQNPREFAEFLLFMAARRVNTYLEIGVSNGGSFFMADSYLRAVNPDFQYSLGCDQSPAPYDFIEYRWRFPKTDYRRARTDEIKLGRERYDLAFIDACHAEKWALHDFQKVKNHCRWVAFHDIVLPRATVSRAWQKIKAGHPQNWEFIDRTLDKTLGIGVVAVAKPAPRKRKPPAARAKSPAR